MHKSADTLMLALVALGAAGCGGGESGEDSASIDYLYTLDDGAIVCAEDRGDGLPEHYYLDKATAVIHSTPEMSAAAAARGLTEVNSCATARLASEVVKEVWAQATPPNLESSPDDAPVDKIVNGSISTAEFVVQIGDCCTGSLINSRWLVTAAHCVGPSGLKTLNIRTAHGTQVHDGQVEVVRHASYSGLVPDDFDFALVYEANGWKDPAHTSSSWRRLFSGRIRQGAILDQYGYGHAAGSGSQCGTQRLGSSIGMDWDNVRTFGHYAKAGEARGCFGDSGGPYMTKTTTWPMAAGILLAAERTDMCPANGNRVWARQVGTLTSWVKARVEERPGSGCFYETSQSGHGYLQCWPKI